MTQIFANIFKSNRVTSELHIELWDVDDDGQAVWRVRVDDDARYIEGRYEDEVWEIVGKAAKAYEEN